MKSKLQTLPGYVSEFETKSFMTDRKVLTCRTCDSTVRHSKKLQIEQHILTKKRTTSRFKVNSSSEIKSKNQLSNINNNNNSPDQQTFNFNLNKILICVITTRNKINIPIFKDFLINCTGHHISSRKHLSGKQTTPIFQKQFKR